MLRQLWDLIEADRRSEFLGLLVLMVIGMGLEMLGVGLVIPVIAVLTAPDLQARFPQVVQHAPWVFQYDRLQLIVFSMLAFFAVYVAKNAFLGFLAWRQGKFIFYLHANLSQRLFGKYLRQSYTFHLENNSAQLIRNVINDINFSTNAMQVTIAMMAEALVMLGIITLLLMVEPLGTLASMIVLGLAAWSFQRAIRSRVAEDGRSRKHYDGLRVQHVQQGLGALKEIKLLGREQAFLAKYAETNQKNSQVLHLQFFHQQLPRLWLEVLAVAGLAVIALSVLYRDGAAEALLPTIGLFGAAAFRMMPSVNRSMTALQSIRFAAPVVTSLHHELIEVPVPVPDRNRSEGKLRFEHGIDIVDVGFTYPGAARPALENVNLSIPRGASVGFVGGSGAGKSTLVDLVLGLLEPQHGRVEVDGYDIRTALRGWQDSIGYVPQSIYLTDDTLRRNVAFGLDDSQIDDAVVWRAVRAAHLEAFVEGLSEGLETQVGERGVRLSGGQRQRIGIARALYHDPPVLVLDEATSSLDTTTESGVMAAVKAMQGDKTIIIVAHRLSTVEHCDFLVRLEMGKLVENIDQRKPRVAMPAHRIQQ